ncbi:MAG: hypothetical protein JNK49_08255 [Planctomycetes bacterium]|nr:hypothetical protein [Planctomycetota bacterium]
MSLLSELKFASLLVYAPQGHSEVSKRSRSVRAAVKRGDRSVQELSAQRLRETGAHWLADFFGADTVLVPVPGSSPMKNPKSLWVPREICHVFVARGLGKEVSTCLDRSHAVPKSAFSLPEERPKPSRHFASLTVSRSLFAPRRITLVDDVITKGATLVAAASRLLEAFPSCEVRAFAVVRTMTRVEVDAILAPCTGVITYNAAADSSRREP